MTRRVLGATPPRPWIAKIAQYTGVADRLGQEEFLSAIPNHLMMRGARPSVEVVSRKAPRFQSRRPRRSRTPERDRNQMPTIGTTMAAIP